MSETSPNLPSSESSDTGAAATLATRRRKPLWIWVLKMVIAIILLFPVLCMLWVWLVTRGRIYDDLELIPYREVGVVLGTSEKVGQYNNMHFTYRMEAAAALYKAGKIKHILVSGDNRVHDYNEPAAMKRRLLKLGVPDEDITLDYAGLRSLDTIVRADKIFGQRSFTIISDDFHVPRCLFIAQANGYDCVGYYGTSVPWKWSARSRIREWLAQFIAVLDVYLWNTQPKHLGKPEKIQKQ